jgi:8-oxo-dGTP diphosphatase
VAVTGGKVVRAAGGLVARTGAGGEVTVLVVHRPRYDDWSLPKGKAESGESDEETALREVEEETGYRCVLGSELPTVRYEDRKGRQKQVRFWLMTVISDDSGAGAEPPLVPNDEPAFVPNDEVDERRWISPAVAATLLSYDADRRLVLSLGGTDAQPAPH